MKENKENSLERNICQKKLLEKWRTSKLCVEFISVPERTKTTHITKKHLLQLIMKLNNLKEAIKKQIARNIKKYSKSSYAYIKSKQNVRDKVGPLEDSAGNIICKGILMAEDINGYFSTVFTLPFPD